MTPIHDMKKITFYLFMGLAYTCLWIASNLHNFDNAFPGAVFNNLWRVAFIVAVNFIFFEYTVPFVLKKRAYVIYNVLLAIPALWVHVMLWSFGLYVWRMIGVGLHIYTPLIKFDTTEQALESQMAFSVGSAFFFGFIRHIYNYVKLKQSEQQLRIEKQQAELNYLKSQTNPHFLFNTLNNIYSLARDKSDLAPESILRLSKMLRYMLYETGGGYIAIEQELKIISDYIALEKLRYDETLRVNYNYDIEDMKQAMPPLLLIPLVENAFKHGVSETRDRPFVDIHLTVRQRQLNFEVRNSVGSFSSGKNVKENIGLSNLRRQLELLYREYSLTTGQDNNGFTSVLTINLATHV